MRKLMIQSFLLMTLATAAGAFTSIVPATTETASDSSTFIDVQASKAAFIDGPIYSGMYYLYTYASSSVSATPIGDNTEYDCFAQVKGTADKNTAATPVPETVLDHDQILLDSAGNTYYGDTYHAYGSYAAFKKHPVARSKPWPWSTPQTRILSLSDYGEGNQPITV